MVIPYIKKELDINDIQYSYVLSLFQFGYMFGSLLAGKLIDYAGTKMGYWFSIFFWSLAAGMHATVRSAFSLAGWRGFLGLSAAGNFPAAIKAISEWFPPHERALATSLFNSGPHFAMITGAPVIAFITLFLGWRWAFVIMGSRGSYSRRYGLFSTVSLRMLPRRAPWTRDSRAPSLAGAASRRAVWGIMFARFMSDPVLVVLYLLAP